MQNSILNFIFGFDDDLHSINRNAEYKKLCEKNLDNYQYLLKSLNEEQAEVFKKFTDLSEDCTALSNEDYFKAGVKIGLRFAVECLCE